MLDTPVKVRFYQYSFLALLVSMVLALTIVWQARQTETKSVALLTNRLTSEIDKSNAELESFIKLISTSDLKELALPDHQSYPYYIFKNTRLMHWSDNQLVPDYNDLVGNYNQKLVNLPHQGIYLVVRHAIELTDKWEVYSLIPIYQSSRINNSYMNIGYNARLFEGISGKLYSTEYPDTYSIFYNEVNYLFSIKLNSTIQYSSTGARLLGISIISAFVCLLVFLYAYALELRNRKKNPLSYLTILSIIPIRMLWLQMEWPNEIHSLIWFDPKMYAVSWINPSLGDLFTNVVVVLFILLFLINSKAPEVKNKKYSGLIAALITLLAFGAWMGIHALVSTFYIHSPFDLNILNADEYSRVFVLIYAIIVLGFLVYFIFNHLLVRILINDSSSINKLPVLIAFVFSILIHYWLKIHWGVWIIFVLVWMLSLRLNTSIDFAKLSYKSFIYFFVVCIGLSLSGAFSLHQFYLESVRNEKSKFVGSVMSDNDLLGEFLMDNIHKQVRNDIFIKTRLFSPFITKATIEQKIRRIYLNNYFDKYDASVHVFNSMGQQIGDLENDIHYTDIKNKFGRSEYSTSYEHLFLISETGNPQNKRYLDFIEVERYGIIIGYIIIDLKLKKVVPNKVYPSLLVDQQFVNSNYFSSFDYAVFDDNIIKYQVGGFNYIKNFPNSWFSDVRLMEQGIYQNRYRHTGFRISDKQWVVVSCKENDGLFIITNFAFLFLIQLVVVFVFLGLYSIYLLLKGRTLNYSTKIQLYLTLSFFIPLLAVSVTSFNIIWRSSAQEVNKEFQRKAENISLRLAESLDLYSKNKISRDDLYAELAKNTSYTDDDINIYNLSGRLIATSQPLIYENNLLSDYINTKALTAIRDQSVTLLTLVENVASLKFQSVYVAVKSFETGEVIAIIGVPFFSSKSDHNKQVVLVFVNTVVIFVLIFIVFLFVSYFVSDRLTQPLGYIANKIAQISLSETNQPLKWNSDDEIGKLVSEYNRMLANLEKSKLLLSQQEKESAWKEMAQQVAHEIKNPLTPMKLSLQHVRRLLVDNQTIEKQQFLDRIDSLLNQIELLSGIATSFSSFAKMPTLKLEPLNLVELLHKVVNLHSNMVPIKLELNEIESAWVNADIPMLNRILTNLILNAIQAIPTDREPKIIATLTASENRYKVSIQDNGSGIPETIRNQIFVPNFSTKFMGSGIGLAISKKGIEQMNGRIWFDTVDNQGTTFFIELPILPHE